MRKILMIIPAYNEEKSILNTIKNLNDSKLNLDYIIINDGSSDNTLQILKDNNLNYVNLPINTGIGSAVQTGYKYALKHNYDIAIQFDGDGQHDAKYVKDFVRKIDEGYDLVIGSRYINKEGFQSSFLRRVGINWIRIVTKMLIGQASTDSTSGYRACNKKVINFFAKDYPIDYPESETYITAVLKKFKVVDIPVIMKERKEGASSIKDLKIIYFMIKVTISLIFAKIIGKEKK